MAVAAAGVMRSRTVRRRVEAEQYDNQVYGAARGFPWDTAAVRLPTLNFFADGGECCPAASDREEAV